MQLIILEEQIKGMINNEYRLEVMIKTPEGIERLSDITRIPIKKIEEKIEEFRKGCPKSRVGHSQ
jgi:hypothetical protein